MSASIPTKGEPAAPWAGRPESLAGKGEVWHTQPAREVARRLETDATRGLTGAEVARRLGQYGPNALAETRERSALAPLGVVELVKARAAANRARLE